MRGTILRLLVLKPGRFNSQIYIFTLIAYLLKPPAIKFQTAVSPKKLNHQPVAGVINPSIIICSIMPAIIYCFNVILYPFRKASLPYKLNIVIIEIELMCNQIG